MLSSRHILQYGECTQNHTVRLTKSIEETLEMQQTSDSLKRRKEIKNKEVKSKWEKYKTNVRKRDLSSNVSTNTLNGSILNSLIKRQRLFKVTTVFKRNNL